MNKIRPVVPKALGPQGFHAYLQCYEDQQTFTTPTKIEESK